MWKKENLRKNFLRVKQIADQNLGRAEKSEVLSEDQHVNEKRVDVVKQVSHNLVKKVTAMLEAPPGTDPEKRLKKLPETSLSHTLFESAALLGEHSLLGAICQQCGECQSVLAKEELQCELDIEREVLAPLQTIAEVDIPSIMKLRKQLSKSTLDMDSAKSRFNSAVRQSHVPGANIASASAKADAVRDEYEEAFNKVETIKDNLSIELCNFISKESDHSSRLVALLEAQATYHKNALKAIKEMIPKMKSTIETSGIKPVFGMSLEDHLAVMDRDISFILEACILTLLDTGMEEEGLFRIAGSALKMKKLKACLDARAVDMEEFSTDPHTVAGVLKQYLRELPEPMLTYDLYSEFIHATQLSHEQKLQALYTTVGKLPLSNYNNFRYLVKFLAILAEKSSVNKMTPSNIAIVMGPNLLWAREESAPNMLTAGTVSSVIETFIVHADYFFPGEIEFSVSGGYPDSPSQEFPQESGPVMYSLPSAMPHSPAPTGGGSPNTANTSPSVSMDALSPSADSSEVGGTSPRTQRRIAKKPAPPPPPDRPSAAAVTAGMSKGAGNGSLPSHAGYPSAPVTSPDTAPLSGSQQGDGEKRLSGPERPHGPPPERPSTRPPERPKAPVVTQSNNQLPAAPPGGHQRSASTGTMHISTSQDTSPGSASQESLQADAGASFTVGQGNAMPSGTATLGRHSMRPSRQADPGASLTVGQAGAMPSGTATLGRHSMRPSRQPPPPPPPINRHTEDTHL